MSFPATQWAIRQRVGGTNKLVLLVLADYANPEGRCWPSIATLADVCGVTGRTVLTAVAALEEIGLVAVERSMGSSNVYRLQMAESIEGSVPVKNLHGTGENSSRVNSENISGGYEDFSQGCENFSPEPVNNQLITSPPPSPARAGGDSEVIPIGDVDRFFGADHAAAADVLRRLPGWTRQEERSFVARYVTGPMGELLLRGVPDELRAAVIAECVFQYAEPKEDGTPVRWHGSRFGAFLGNAGSRARRLVTTRAAESAPTESPGDVIRRKLAAAGGGA
jgi:hypothetical protein